MKLLNKTYFLIGILIVAATINLYLVYQTQQSGVTQSYSIVRAGDLKVKTETVSSLANSIANGNEGDRENLKRETQEFETILMTLKSGGSIRGQQIATIPIDVLDEHSKVTSSWNNYKNSAETVQKTSVFDKNAVSALNYVLEKNGEMVLTTHELVKELEPLDRNYNKHKEISRNLEELAKNIGQQALLISIGEGKDAQNILRENRIQFDAGIRNLLQIPVDDLGEGVVNENLQPLPRENSESLRKLDPLWEAVQLRIEILEERSLLSENFDSAKKNLEIQRGILLSDIDSLLDEWTNDLNKQRNQQQTIVQILLGVDILVFFVVLFVIRNSLGPLNIITGALSKVRQGIYEKINYQASDEMGELVKSFNVMSDTIKEKEEEARKTDQAKDEFLTMITHELKTPLVPIQGYVDILLGEHLGKLTQKQKERLNIIKTSANALLGIISDLLDVQKLELGQLRIKKETRSIKETISKSIASLKPEIDELGLKVEDKSPNILVLHDSERITQVLTNLIKNSMKAVKPKTGKIEIITEDVGDSIRVSVKDDGIGIPQEKQSGLFKKFYQVDASLTREMGGSGLGLAICKGIVNAHGGEIKVESSPNVGSVFSFTIPKQF